MKYLEKLLEKKLPAQNVGGITTKGKTGTTATDRNDPKLVDKEGKPKRNAKELLKTNTPQTKPNLPDSQKEHAEYKRMGLMMAEALGYRVDEAIPAVAGALARGAGMLAKKGAQAGAKMAQKAGQKAAQKAGEMAQKAGQKAVGMAKEKAAEFAANRMQKKEEEPGMEVAHTEYKRMGIMMAEALGLREEDDNPTDRGK